MGSVPGHPHVEIQLGLGWPLSYLGPAGSFQEKMREDVGPSLGLPYRSFSGRLSLIDWFWLSGVQWL